MNEEKQSFINQIAFFLGIAVNGHDDEESFNLAVSNIDHAVKLYRQSTQTKIILDPTASIDDDEL